jgi:uncharacterized repeat protein (TIGR01451 family)
LAPEDTATLTVVVAVSLDLSGSATNTVTVTGVDVGDPNPDDNTAETTDPVVSAVDLELDKQLDGELVRGREVDWTMVVTNLGPSRAADVTVTDTLPDGLTFSSATGDGSLWSCTGGDDQRVTCVLDGQLDPGDEATLVVTTLVDEDAPAGPISNSASVGSDATEATTANNASVASDVLSEVVTAPTDGDGSGGSPLAFTGGTVGPLLLTGGLLTVAGLVLILLRRRRVTAR